MAGDPENNGGKMTQKRLSRKQLLKEPDEFITFSEKGIQWVKENPKKLVYGAGVFLAAVILVSGFRYYRQTRSQTSSFLLSQNLQEYQNDVDTKDPVQALSLVQPEMERLIKKYNDQSSGRLARIYLGHFCLQAGKPDQAIAYYKKALDSFGDDPYLANLILNGLGLAYSQTGDKNSAINYYERIVISSHTLYKDSALFHLGILYEQMDQGEKAKDMFKQLAELFPDSIYAEMSKEKTVG
jgi:tetratricopeptide (TPR) repeat protein